MTIMIMVLTPSVLVFLLGVCLIDHGRQWDRLTEEQQNEDNEQQMW